MKTKFIVLIAVTAIITLSFTFSSRNENAKKTATSAETKVDDAPAGGFVSEDKF